MLPLLVAARREQRQHQACPHVYQHLSAHESAGGHAGRQRGSGSEEDPPLCVLSLSGHGSVPVASWQPTPPPPPQSHPHRSTGTADMTHHITPAADPGQEGGGDDLRRGDRYTSAPLTFARVCSPAPDPDLRTPPSRPVPVPSRSVCIPLLSICHCQAVSEETYVYSSWWRGQIALRLICADAASASALPSASASATASASGVATHYIYRYDVNIDSDSDGKHISCEELDS